MAEAEKADTRILNVLMGLKDDFGREVVLPVPLLFHRVNEEQQPPSDAPLFELPSEILGEIIQKVDSGSLASLALVNRDCQQLARSRQFASVLFDYSDSSLSLIDKLLAESRERQYSATGCVSKPSVGACIRRITVATHPGWVSHRHKVSLDQEFDAENEDCKKRLSEVSPAFFDKYLLDLQELFSNRKILPNLELLDWEDRIAIPRALYVAIARSSVRHLTLFRVAVEEEFKIEQAFGPESGLWPLQTLHLEVHWNIFGREQGSTSPLYASTLRLCAPTVVSLTWEDWIDRNRDPQSLLTESQSCVPHFPSLRNLKLGNVTFSEPETLKALLKSKLLLLIADTERSAIHTDCFQNCGTIASLDTFVWESFHIPADHRLDFLRTNTQLSKFKVTHPPPSELLQKQLLPLLSSCFKNLRSLSLAWEDADIPNSALDIISTLKLLEQIHLSAGQQIGWKHNWLIDHEALRARLRLLPHLKKVAFSWDSYHSDSPFSMVDLYYEDKFYNVDEVDLEPAEELVEPDIRGLRVCVWERLHREWSVLEADEYVKELLLNLEWICLGQVPMQVEKQKQPIGSVERFSVPLSAERDDCWTLLRKMFGGDLDGEMFIKKRNSG